MNAVDHVKSALTAAQSALAALIENEATLESIAQAAHAIAESQRQGGAVSHMACVGNDYGYEHVFSRWIEAMGTEKDVLVAITTSGTSKNIVAAAKAAKAKGMTVVALTGKAGSLITDEADIAVVTPAGRWADRVQELHIKVIHILIELIERELDAQNYNEGA